MKFTDEEVKEFEQEMIELGMELSSIEEVTKHKGLGILVDLDTDIDYSSIIDSNLVIKKLTKRQDELFIIPREYNKETKTLTIAIGQPIPEEYYNFHKKAYKSTDTVGTTFPDFCWYHSEGTTQESLVEVETKPREEANLGDLTWILPSRFADNLIEIMHTLNQSFLQGLMQDTIVYGPYIFED